MSQLYAVIDPASPRYPGWIRDFGRDYLPVLPGGPVPRLLDDGLDSDRETMCYLLDVEAIDPTTLGRIIERTAELHGIRFEDLAVEFARDGMPIEAEGLIVGTNPNMDRLRFPFWSGRKEVS